MGNTGRSISVNLDSFVFTHKFTELNADQLTSTEDVEKLLGALCKPELAVRRLTFEMLTANSRRLMTLSNLREDAEAGRAIKITAREVDKLMLLAKTFKDGLYVGKMTLFESDQAVVAGIKAKIKRHFSISKEIGVFTNIMELEDHMTLAGCGVIEDCRLVILPLGESKMLLAGAIPNLVPWRILKSGLSLEGTCENSSCPAFSQRVVVSLGFGSFTLAEELMLHYACPICSDSVRDFSMLGLFNCSSTFDRPSSTASTKFEGLNCSTHSYTKTKLEKWRNAVVTVDPRGS
jgi:hypothetical protein